MYIGYLAWYSGIARIGIARAGQLQLLQPSLSLLWAWPLLGEHLNLDASLTALVVLAAVAAGRRSEVRASTYTERRNEHRMSEGDTKNGQPSQAHEEHSISALTGRPITRPTRAGPHCIVPDMGWESPRRGRALTATVCAVGRGLFESIPVLLRDEMTVRGAILIACGWGWSWWLRTSGWGAARSCRLVVSVLVASGGGGGGRSVDGFGELG